MIRALPLVLLLSACALSPLPEPTAHSDAPAPDVGFNRSAIAFLDAIQPQSITENREYCGYMGIGPDGGFEATKPRRGRARSCPLPKYPVEFEITASYHTHAAFDHGTDSEVPSTQDITTDIEDQTFGYIATPGGRIWLVDWRDGTARQLCGIGCVTSDPAFVPGYAGFIKSRYSLPEIENREGW